MKNQKFSLIFFLSLIILFFQVQDSFSQEKYNFNWWNPEQYELNVIEGQAWPEQAQSRYDRLPSKAEQTVRKSVWNLSKHSAGLMIRFRSNASNIIVRYQVNGNIAMSHMPATGVSGVDLYAKGSDGQWIWCRGIYSFGDTIKYDYRDIRPNDRYHKKGREYHLYLPLYNSIKWLEIGVPEKTLFEPLPVRPEKPIVVYGTSIAQGACASRPGMAWTAILERKMDRPLINLGFSGNGLLEKELINLLAEIDAKTYILDCLPNLVPKKNLSSQDVHQRIISSVKSLKQNRPLVPILLVEHAGYSDGTTNKNRQTMYSDLNKVVREAFAQLKSEGFGNIFLLQKSEFGLGIESFVDGTHPSDLGMMEYANGYEETVRKILNEPIGIYSTTKPVIQSREPDMYNWEERHRELLRLNKENPPKICFFGNSITHYWGGTPKAVLASGEDSWDKYLGDLGVRNFGFGWDRIENVLWRVYHGELDNFETEQVVMMLGTNNLHLNTNEEILTGLELLLKGIKIRQPNSRILVFGLYPRKEKEDRIYELNLKIAQLAGLLNINFADVSEVLLNENGKINESFFSDGLHPNKEGYQRLAPEIRKYLVK
jgi:lysophospholipase L1-like esterase